MPIKRTYDELQVLFTHKPKSKSSKEILYGEEKQESRVYEFVIILNGFFKSIYGPKKRNEYVNILKLQLLEFNLKCCIFPMVHNLNLLDAS